MAVKDVKISVSGVLQPTNFDSGLQAYVTTIPLEVTDSYDVLVVAEDYAGNVTTYASFVTINEGEIARFFCKDALNRPVSGVVITAYYRNGGNGSNNGVADSGVTGDDGITYLYLQPSAYNIEIAAAGFGKTVLLNFQVAGGLLLFNAPGGTVPENHVVRDNTTALAANAFIKIKEAGLTPLTTLVANIKTGGDGAWSTLLKSGKTYSLVFEKNGYDARVVSVVIP